MTEKEVLLEEKEKSKEEIMADENTLNFGMQDTLNISESRREHIIDYIKMASKGRPEEIYF